MCYFYSKCENLQNKEILPANIEIQLKDGGITIDWKYLIYDKKYFAPSRLGDRCYLGMFRSMTLLPGEWIFGANAMQDYYFVYDLELKTDN